MKPLPAAVALVAVFLAGCTVVETGGNTWFKEGATAQEREAALNAAQLQAAQSDTTPADKHGMVIRSMTAQGWRMIAKASAPPLKTDAARKAPLPLRTGTASGM